MLNWLRPVFARIWQAPARLLLRLGVHPNIVTMVGTVGVVCGALYFFPKGGRSLFWGVVVVTCFVITDMLDGTMARLGAKSTRLGAFLDSTFDRIADAAIFGALVVAFIDVHRPTAYLALLALAVGSFVPYARARAEGLGVTANVGIAERADRLVLVLVATGLVGLGLPLPVLTWTLAVLTLASAITVIQRTWKVVQADRQLSTATN